MSFEPKLTPFLKETGSPKPNHEGVSTTRWNVESGNKIPSYPLERTVKVDATTKVVASRVDANIKKRSVQAEFDSDKARAICVTEGFLKYHVTLFDAGNNQTLVEVQRRKGCSMEFRRERLAIINAAKGSFTQTQSMPRLTIPPDLVSESKYAPPSYEDITAMLENIVLSLHAKHRDSKLLALRHVAGMTDIETANVHTSFNAAKIILDSEIGVREIITDYLVSGPQDETGIMMRHSGLTILTNCLTLLEKGDKIEELSKKENIWFTESLFPSLVEDIKRCKSYHNAFLSSKCLCMLLKKSSIVRATAREDDDLRDILEKAASIGQKNHNKLHDEAESTIRALECI
mmetsp:Transcript_3311/g.4992  ORF Transcript_3311/g.4992 Transcript_3311/m.4992 type:complete len:346 (+) Transcript_3311:784-1821(+)